MRSPLQIGDESTINNILRLMEDAQSSKAPVQRFADRVILSLLFCAMIISKLTFISCLEFLYRPSWFWPC
jgi:Cu+-exporting ATPase